MRKFLRSQVIIAVLVLVAVFTMAFSSCGTTQTNTSSEPAAQSQAESKAVSASEEISQIGEGQKSFVFEVTFSDGKVTKLSVSTDKTTVGEALIDNGLIAGDAGTYGLYVKTVLGVTADYDADKTYWAFYVNGAYASSGVDTTDIAEGTVYGFKIEK